MIASDKNQPLFFISNEAFHTVEEFVSHFMRKKIYANHKKNDEPAF